MTLLENAELFAKSKHAGKLKKVASHIPII
jgi:hypothetical protein